MVCNSSDSDVDLSDNCIEPLRDEERWLKRENIVIGDYVIVKFSGKKKVVHYVGLVVEPQEVNSETSGDESDYTVKFLRRETPSSFSFIFPSVDEITVIAADDIVQKLPSPVQTGGTARVGRHVVFPVDFGSYNMR